MQLILLHGAPAVGKFTIARALESAARWKVLHSHLTLDVARSLFEFGTMPFWNLVHELRIPAIRAAAETNETAVYTCCYDHPNDLSSIETIERLVIDKGGELIPIFLTCSTEELMRRVGAPNRVDMKKVTTKEGLSHFLNRWNLVALPRANCITVNTENRTARECADEILAQVGAPSPRSAE
jgi:shikimate kinase